MIINNYDIPLEIVKLILSFINDNDTYKNTRLVCKVFYHILSPLKVYDIKGNLKLKLFFINKQINIFNKNNYLVQEYNIKKYGGYKSTIFNDKGIIIHTIELFPPNKVVKKDIKFNNISITEINLDSEIVKKNNYTKFLKPCIIS